MACKSCGSENLRNFRAEIAFHFPGPKNVDQPIVWVFPDVMVCLDCGLTEFVVPENKLNRLAIQSH